LLLIRKVMREQGRNHMSEFGRGTRIELETAGKGGGTSRPRDGFEDASTQGPLESDEQECVQMDAAGFLQLPIHLGEHSRGGQGVSGLIPRPTSRRSHFFELAAFFEVNAMGSVPLFANRAESRIRGSAALGAEDLGGETWHQRKRRETATPTALA
jgi:hypothetical protein